MPTENNNLATARSGGVSGGNFDKGAVAGILESLFTEAHPARNTAVEWLGYEGKKLNGATEEQIETLLDGLMEAGHIEFGDIDSARLPGEPKATSQPTAENAPQAQSASHEAVVEREESDIGQLDTLRLKVRAILQPDNIPDELKVKACWLLWKATKITDPATCKFDKVPMYATNGKNRSGTQGGETDRANLTTFDKALAAFGRHPDTIWGLGIAVLPDLDLTIYDGDKCVVNGAVAFDTAEIIAGTYAELSPSGTGVRAIWAGATSSSKNLDTGHELFGNSGFVTITGNRIGADTISPLSTTKKETLEAICSKTSTAPVPRQQDDFANYAAPLDGWDIARVKSELLANIPADCSYDEWRDVVAGCIHQFGKTNEVREMLRDWSATAPEKFSITDFNTLYNSLKPAPAGKSPITLRSVINKAQRCAPTNGSDTVPDEVETVSLDIPFDADWPPGMAGEIARYIHQTCLTPIKSFSIAAGLFAVSLLSGNKFYVRRTDTSLNLYQVLSAPTGKGKEGPRKAIKNLFSASRYTNKLWEGAASATGLLRALVEDHPYVFAAMPDEFGLMLQAYSGEKANPNDKKLIACILSLFGCARTVFLPSAYANTKDNIPPIPNPYFVLFGMTTPETLYPAFNKDMVDSGTVNRILVVSMAGVQPENTDLDFTVPKTLLDSIRAFEARLSLGQDVALEFEDGAFELLEKLAKNPDMEGSPEALWGRYREQVIRVAGVLAVGNGACITKAHVEWAHRYVDWCVRGFVRNLTPRLADGNFAKMANKALEAIRNAKSFSGDKQFAKLCRKGLMPTGKLSKLLHIPKKEKTAIIEYLIETQQIKRGLVDEQEVFWVPK